MEDQKNLVLTETNNVLSPIGTTLGLFKEHYILLTDAFNAEFEQLLLNMSTLDAHIKNISTEIYAILTSTTDSFNRILDSMFALRDSITKRIDGYYLGKVGLTIVSRLESFKESVKSHMNDVKLILINIRDVLSTKQLLINQMYSYLTSSFSSLETQLTAISVELQIMDNIMKTRANFTTPWHIQQI